MNFNSIVVALLRSPLHFIFSNTVLLLSYTGRKSGKRYRLPVNYVQAGDRLLVISHRSRTWWRNLRNGASVGLRLKGYDYNALAEALEEPAAVVEALGEYFQYAPHTARYFNVCLDSAGRPFLEDLLSAAQERVAVRIRLLR